MDKETILELSRKENEGHDELQRAAVISAHNAAFLVGGIICAIIFCLQLIFGKETNYSLYAVFYAMFATAQIVKYKKTKKTAALVVFILIATASACYFTCYVMSLFR